MRIRKFELIEFDNGSFSFQELVQHGEPGATVRISYPTMVIKGGIPVHRILVEIDLFMDHIKNMENK